MGPWADKGGSQEPWSRHAAAAPLLVVLCCTASVPHHPLVRVRVPSYSSSLPWRCAAPSPATLSAPSRCQVSPVERCALTASLRPEAGALSSPMTKKNIHAAHAAAAALSSVGAALQADSELAMFTRRHTPLGCSSAVPRLGGSAGCRPYPSPARRIGQRRSSAGWPWILAHEN